MVDMGDLSLFDFEISIQSKAEATPSPTSYKECEAITSSRFLPWIQLNASSRQGGV
jgi:hypothetical protein